jgi:hypothetical protein
MTKPNWLSSSDSAIIALELDGITVKVQESRFDGQYVHWNYAISAGDTLILEDVDLMTPPRCSPLDAMYALLKAEHVLMMTPEFRTWKEGAIANLDYWDDDNE